MRLSQLRERARETKPHHATRCQSASILAGRRRALFDRRQGEDFVGQRKSKSAARSCRFTGGSIRPSVRSELSGLENELDVAL